MTFLSFLPILALLICLLQLKMPAGKAGAISMLVAVAVCMLTFKPGILGLSISMAKGFGLAMFVIFIIWGAMFLYNLVNEIGALQVINENIAIIVKDRFLQFILLSWIFASFLQGIAGFGVPVIVVTPILIGMGFDPVLSAAAVLVGHSWSISFGSMGSSISAIDMVTNGDLHYIVIYAAVFGIIGMIITGISVCAIYDGKRGILRGIPYILCISAVMGGTLILLAFMDMTSVMGLIAGLTGMVTLFLMYRLQCRHIRRTSALSQNSHDEQKRGKQENIKGKKRLYKNKINFLEAVMPYLLIILFSVCFYIISPTIKIELDFPGYTSMTGIIVKAEEGYTSFNVMKYPFSIIMMASFLSGILYWKKKVLNGEKIKKIASITIKKCASTTITLVFLLVMAQLMMDTGMIDNLAEFLVKTTRKLYPFVAPYIGLLGAFVTGSNTNSNVLFGSLQETAANALGISSALMCAVQSIGASLGGGIGPTTVALGAGAAQVVGKESLIYKKTLAPILIGVTALGLTNVLLIYCFH